MVTSEVHAFAKHCAEGPGLERISCDISEGLDGEHVSQHFTHVITCYECASSHALVTFTRLYLHVSFMGFSWGKCRTRHG